MAVYNTTHRNGQLPLEIIAMIFDYADLITQFKMVCLSKELNQLLKIKKLNPTNSRSIVNYFRNLTIVRSLDHYLRILKNWICHTQ